MALEGRPADRNTNKLRHRRPATPHPQSGTYCRVGCQGDLPNHDVRSDEWLSKVALQIGTPTSCGTDVPQPHILNQAHIAVSVAKVISRITTFDRTNGSRRSPCRSEHQQAAAQTSRNPTSSIRHILPCRLPR